MPYRRRETKYNTSEGRGKACPTDTAHSLSFTPSLSLLRTPHQTRVLMDCCYVGWLAHHYCIIVNIRLDFGPFSFFSPSAQVPRPLPECPAGPVVDSWGQLQSGDGGCIKPVLSHTTRLYATKDTACIFVVSFDSCLLPKRQ